jgi:hypothetical protein
MTDRKPQRYTQEPLRGLFDHLIYGLSVAEWNALFQEDLNRAVLEMKRRADQEEKQGDKPRL